MGTFAKAFYRSKEWQITREYIMRRDNYLCRQCGLKGEEVHHIIHLTPENIWDTSITMNPDNLILLCRGCHQDEHRKDRASGHMGDKDKREIAQSMDKMYVFDENGYLVESPL